MSADHISFPSHAMQKRYESHKTLPLIHFSTFDNIRDLKPFHAILNQFAKYGLANFIGTIFASSGSLSYTISV